MTIASLKIESNKDVRILIAHRLGVDVNRVTDEAHFTDDFGADWLERLELMIEIEAQFPTMEFTDDDIDQIDVVGDLIRHLKSARGAQRARASHTVKARYKSVRIEPSCAELLAKPLTCLRVRAAVERKGLDVRAFLADMQCEREISDFQAQPRAVFQRMCGKAAKGVVPTEIRVPVVRLRWDVGPREPLYRIMGLQAGLAQHGESALGEQTPVASENSDSCISMV